MPAISSRSVRVTIALGLYVSGAAAIAFYHKESSTVYPATFREASHSATKSSSRDAHEETTPRASRTATPHEMLPTSLEAILANPDATWRSEHFARIAADLPDADIARTLRELDGAMLDTPYAAILLNRWAALLPHEASAWATTLSQGDTRQRMIEAVAYSWADADLHASLQWAQTLPDAGERLPAMQQALASGMHAQPKNALQEAGTLPDSPERSLLISSCLQQWARLAPQEAAAWARQHTNDAARHAAIASVVQSWARTDPASAADLAIAEIKDSRALQKAVVTVVAQGRTNDPNLIRTWIDQFPEGPIRTAAEAEWTRGHTNFDPPPASRPGEDIEDRTPPARE